MAEDNKLNIKLNIAGGTYPLAIEKSKEEIYRRAEKEVNQLATKFSTRFRASEKDYLAMAALQIAVQNVEMQMSRSLGEELEELAGIEEMIDDYLSSQKI